MYRSQIFRLSSMVMCLGFLSLGVVSCTKDSSIGEDPKRRLTQYISKSFNVKQVRDRKALEGYLTGDAKIRLAAWSNEQFKKAFIESERKFNRLRFLQVRSLTPNEINITYELTYTDTSKANEDAPPTVAKITNKKLCLMTRENGTWYIREVRNVKQMVEYQNEMTITVF